MTDKSLCPNPTSAPQSFPFLQIEADRCADESGKNREPNVEHVLELRNGIKSVVDPENGESNELSEVTDAKHDDECDCKSPCGDRFTFLRINLGRRLDSSALVWRCR